MPTERGRRLLEANPSAYLERRGLEGLTARFARILSNRASENADRRRSRVVGPAEVGEAWDAVMKPARRPPLAAVLAQEACVLLSGLLLSAAGGVVWVGDGGGWLAASLLLGAVGFGACGALLRWQSRV